jgi:ribosome-binding ATPase YchF (GTP1/OBG family)
MKPVAVIEGILETNELIKKVLEKAGIIFFYTAGKQEVHAWPVNAGSDIVACAGKIHTDLARGFIKADIVSFEDFMKCHNMNDAKGKGFVKLVDRDYIIKEADIIEIRFNI